MPHIERQIDNAGPGEALPPEIKILQGTSKIPEGAKAGQFIDIAQQTFDTFNFIFVDRAKTRTYWGRETIEDEPPACSSLNADSYEAMDGSDCHKCDKRLDVAASVSASQRRAKCVIHYTIYGIKLPEWIPFMTRVNGISTGEFLRLESVLTYNPALRDPKTKETLWHIVVIPVSTVLTNTPAGSAYALKFGQITILKEETDKTLAFNLSAAILGQSNLLLEEGQTENVPATPPAPFTVQAQTIPQPNIRTIESTPEKKTEKPATSKTKTVDVSEI